MLTPTLPTRPLLFSLCLILTVSLSACDSGGSSEEEPEFQSSFSLNVTGEGYDESVTGFAYFGEATDPETGREAFILFFSDTEDIDQQSSSGLSGLVGRGSGRPGSGTYAIADLSEGDNLRQDAFVVWISRTGKDSSTEMYISKSGTLNIASSSEERIEGDFDVEATAFQFTEEGVQEVPVTLEGDFDARSNASVFVPDFTF